jgi:hypothetical protein
MENAMANLDMIGAIALTASVGAIIGTLVPNAFTAAGSRVGAAGIFTLWFAAVVAAASSPLFDPRVGFGTPALGVAVAAPVAAALLLAAYAPRLKAAIRSVPLTALVAVNIFRILGLFFVLLYLTGRLPAPFAPTAGWGDIFIGVTAPAVAWLVARREPGWRGVAWLWNSLGLLDLVVAVGLGLTSAEGSPLRLFFTGPSTAPMTNLPWILIPGFAVPLLAVIHFAIFDRLLIEGRAVAPGDKSGLGSAARGVLSWASRLSG